MIIKKYLFRWELILKSNISLKVKSYKWVIVCQRPIVKETHIKNTNNSHAQTSPDHRKAGKVV